MEDREGAIVALDPRTGDVLAMVSRPAFDPNVFARGIRGTEWRTMLENRKHPLNSKAVQGTYPPGSTFKVVMAAAALDGRHQSLHPDLCGGGISSATASSAAGEGRPRSSGPQALVPRDVFFYQVGQRPSTPSPSTPIAGPATRPASRLSTRAAASLEQRGSASASGAVVRWRDAVVAIGQGYVTVTPLQMNVIAAIANGGTSYRRSS
jgi:penicillin-binding protein 2